MTVLYKLASGQLSKQSHYDFGLRALKAVLVMAGELKRGSPDLSEVSSLSKYSTLVFFLFTPYPPMTHSCPFSLLPYPKPISVNCLFQEALLVIDLVNVTFAIFLTLGCCANESVA